MQFLTVTYNKLGVNHWGTYAEYVKVTEPKIIRLPDGLSDLDAAATQVAMATAWELVVTKGKVREGEDVIVNAAGSGVGSVAVQIAALVGARVIATAGSDEKLDRARQLGASEVINYSKQNIVDEAMKMTDGRGVDVECVGGNILQQSLEVLYLNGRLSTAGAYGGEKVEIDMIEFFRKKLTMTSTHFAPVATSQLVLKLVNEGKLRPVIEKIFPLKNMKAAHAAVSAVRFVAPTLCPGQLSVLCVRRWFMARLSARRVGRVRNSSRRHSASAVACRSNLPRIRATFVAGVLARHRLTGAPGPPSPTEMCRATLSLRQSTAIGST